MPEVNETYHNIDTENSVYWGIVLNPPYEVLSTEINWSGEKLELLDHEIVESLHLSGQTYHKVQMAVDKGGNIISLIKNYDDSCKVFFGQLGCLFPSNSSLSSILHFLFLISVIG